MIYFYVNVKTRRPANCYLSWKWPGTTFHIEQLARCKLIPDNFRLNNSTSRGGHANLLCIAPILSDVPEETNDSTSTRYRSKIKLVIQNPKFIWLTLLALRFTWFKNKMDLQCLNSNLDRYGLIIIAWVRYRFWLVDQCKHAYIYAIGLIVDHWCGLWLTRYRNILLIVINLPFIALDYFSWLSACFVAFHSLSLKITKTILITHTIHLFITISQLHRFLNYLLSSPINLLVLGCWLLN